MDALTLGPEGTYSHRAASAVAESVSFAESMTAIVDAVASGRQNRGVVPIENSIEGSVTESLDALAAGQVAVLEEIIVPIRHALIAQRETFDRVESHSQALGQCREYLDRHYPGVDREPVASTARSVERARENASIAAIAHPDNATGDLLVLDTDIQDRDSNVTRFFVVGPPDDRRDTGSKSTFVVDPGVDHPGLLLELLEPFADRDINLSRLESRPSGRELGDYVFHVDVEAGLDEDRTRDALAEIEALANEGWVRHLGSYDTRRLDG
ncbi:MAG: prephenate dehydratase [Halococcoides sp.]